MCNISCGRCSVIKYVEAYGIVRKARWADLSTNHHHIKPEPWGPSRRIYPYIVRAMQYVFSRTIIYLKRKNQTEQRSKNERVRDGLISP